MSEPTSCKIEKFLGNDLKISTLAFESADVVPVDPGKHFLVPVSILGETVVTYEGLKPYVFENEDGRGNLVMTMPKNTTVVADFASESRGRIHRRKKIFTSVN